ncbi:hypothetical protein NE237_027821 [Protea cynaroides]|uniref:Xylanase inhibitor N-terminal domain-containing protein n=1 Tax=Protea cynaroides TaxID=273540 RepID=A0A9Q0JSA7_9MAGN|nr:hypothetical protein NE237_027821 [Protea cynaroides]
MTMATGGRNATRAHSKDFSSSIISGLFQGNINIKLRPIPSLIPRNLFLLPLYPIHRCCARNLMCRFAVRSSYASTRSLTTMDVHHRQISTKTLTFQGTKVGKVKLRCGHDNEGLFVGAAGLLGLSQGRRSFPSQTRCQFGRKFSYLEDRQSSASMPLSVIFSEEEGEEER